MTKRIFPYLGVLVITIAITIILGACVKNGKDPDALSPSPSEKSTSPSTDNETPEPADKDTPTPTATPRKTPVVFPEVDKEYVNSFSSESTYWYWGEVIKDGEKHIIFSDLLKKYVEGFDYIFTNLHEQGYTLTLTFNEAWDDPNQNTNDILDVLKEKNVKATFYLTKEYLNNEKYHDVIRRMVDEGHSLGSKGSANNGIQSLSTDNAIKLLLDMEAKLQEVLGDDTLRMGSFRPSGQFSRRDLAIAKELGYKLAFWSYDYNDWQEVTDKAHALTRMKSYMFDGTVYSFTASNKANSELLGDFIDEALGQGFEFVTIG